MRVQTRTRLIEALRRVDLGIAHRGLGWERPSLIAFLFHSVFPGQAELHSGVVLPQERLTVSAFVTFVEHLLGTDHRFVSIQEVVDGLPAGGRYAHFTLDDGYANNLLLLDLLRSYQIPATVSVPVTHVREGKAFWWDVLYRERFRRGQAEGTQREIARLYTKPPAEIDRYLTAEFGQDALRPVGDLDRALTPQEVSELASEPLITIANHTADHVSLVHRSPEEMSDQIGDAQRYLRQVTGTAPLTITFPHGDYDSTVIEVARRNGLELGITVEERKNALHLDADGLMRIGRFSVTCDDGLVDRLRLCCSDVGLERLLRRALRRER